MAALLISIALMMEGIGLPIPGGGGVPPPQLPVVVDFVPPPPGQMYIESLWRMRLNNLSTETYSAYVYVTIEKSGQGLLMEATTSVFILPPGIISLSSADLSPIRTDFYNNNFENSVSVMGNFPDGFYIITVYVYEEGGGLLGTDSFTQEVQNQSPPELQYPTDGSEVTEPLPLFTWIPSLPEDDIQYTIRIVNVLSGQSPENAMTSNPAFFTQEGLTVSELAYPVYADRFETGEKYAWQVKAFGMGVPVGESEIWSFTCSGSGAGADGGSVLWQCETGKSVVCSPALTIHGSVVCGSHDGRIYCIDSRGTETWRYAAGGEVYAVSVGPRGKIYASGSFGICCLDTSGFCIWRTGITGKVTACPSVSSEGIVYAGSEEGLFYALNAEDGSLLDTLETDGPLRLPAAVDSSGYVYFAGSDKYIRCVSFTEGALEEVWSFRADDSFCGGPVLFGGNVYAVAGRDVMCLESDGTPLWNSRLPSRAYTGPVVLSSGDVTVCTGSGNAYTLEGSTGSRIGVIPAGAVITATPAITVTGSILLGCDDYTLKCFTPSGFSLWEYETDGVVRSSPTIGVDGTIYFGSDDNSIYAVSGTGVGPMLNGWPQYCLDSSNNSSMQKGDGSR